MATHTEHETRTKHTGSRPPENTTDWKPQKPFDKNSLDTRSTDPAHEQMTIAEEQRRRGQVIEQMGMENYQKHVDQRGEDTGNPNLPVNKDRPFVDGTSSIGGTLSCTMGNWDNMQDDPHSYSYRWARDGEPITDAALDSYIVVEDDVSHSLSCLVTAQNSVGNVSAMSNVVGPIPSGESSRSSSKRRS